VAEVERIADWKGQEVVDADGEKIGKLEDVYFDVETSDAAFAAVKTGFFGRGVSLAPLAQVTLTRDQVRIAYSKDDVKSAPEVESDGDLSADEEAELFAHYRLGPPPGGREVGPNRVRYQTATAEANRAEAAAAAESAQAEAEQRAQDAEDARRQAIEQGAIEEPASDPDPQPAGAEPMRIGGGASSVEDRLAALEERVRALEQRAS
jgi:sporulation protein YlmC with PRC-barrel domain